MRLAAIQQFDLSNSFDCVGLFSWINNLGQNQIISFFTCIESRSLLQRPAHDTAQQSFTGLGELHTPDWMVLCLFQHCLFTKPAVHCSWNKVLEFIGKNLNPTNGKIPSSSVRPRVCLFISPLSVRFCADRGLIYPCLSAGKANAWQTWKII